MTWEIRQGDALEVLRTLPDASVQCCVTSPPYWGLRDYGVPGQLGLEASPLQYVARLVELFREVRRVLTLDGTLWLNLGDSYAGSRCGGNSAAIAGRGKDESVRAKVISRRRDDAEIPRSDLRVDGLKPKELVGMPWRVAFALQADGWWLRSDIVWSKPNPMPESVSDRPTKAHEYIFLLAKSERYYYDAAAVAEPVAGNFPSNHPRTVFDNAPPPPPGQPPHTGLRRYGKGNARTFRGGGAYVAGRSFNNGALVPRESHGNAPNETGLRNRRSVWTVATEPFAEAHRATFPQALVEPCILAGSRPGDLVLDPFAGSGTVGVVALRRGRDFLGVELNTAYCEMARRRIAGPLFAQEGAR